MIEKPFVADYEDDLEAFRRLSPRERIEQLTLKLETDEAFVATFKDAFNAWEKQDDAIRESMDKFILNSSSGVADK